MHEVCLEENIATPMRDGTILRSDIFRPNGLGEYPVLVSRTPYDKRRQGYRRIAKFMAERGYICVLQDIRGTHASEGEYHLARNGRQHTMDAEDGFDTVEWAAKLPSTTGKSVSGDTLIRLGRHGSQPAHSLRHLLDYLGREWRPVS